jgi:hypothetical protein
MAVITMTVTKPAAQFRGGVLALPFRNQVPFVLWRPTTSPLVSEPQRGLEAALGDEARPKPSRMLDAKQQADHRGDGLCPAAAGPLAMDGGADCAGGNSERHRRQGRARNDPPPADPARAEAVAGKKCGASRSWTRST